MAERDPLLLRRLLELRRVPALAGAELAELAMLAENVVETSHEGGAVVATPAGPGAIHLILSGKIAAGDVTLGPHQSLGLLEVLARRPLAAPAVAVGEARTLRLTAGDVRDILEDNAGLLLIAIRELAAAALVAPGAWPAGPPDPLLTMAPPTAGPLGLVERMIVLRRQIPFAPAALRVRRTAPLEPIALIAHASKEVTWPAGAVMAEPGAPAHAASFLLEGRVRVGRGEGAPLLVGPGGSVGVLESLAAARHAAGAEVVAPVRALEVGSSIIFDVLEDHPELGLSMIEALAGALLEARDARDARDAPRPAAAAPQ